MATTTVDHYLPLFGRDFLAATAGWTAAERGHYITLLIVQWEQGGLPAGLDRLELVSPGVSAVWEIVQPKFPECDDGLRRNRRLEEHREKCKELKDARSEAGKRGSDARWGRNGIATRSQTDGKPMANGMANGMTNGATRDSQANCDESQATFQRAEPAPEFHPNRHACHYGQCGSQTDGKPMANGMANGMAKTWPPTPTPTPNREEDNTRAPGGEPPNGVEPGEADGDPAAADAAPVGSRESGAVGREPGAAPGGESRLSRIAQDGRPGPEPAGDTPTPEKANGAAPRAAAGGARAPADPWRSPGWAHDEWARIAAAWNATDRAVPWTLVTPPNGFADLAASPGWLASALAGIAMLPDCRRFARPVPWTQFVRDLDRILAGEFRDPPPERRELAGAAAGGAGGAGGRPQRRGNMR